MDTLASLLIYGAIAYHVLRGLAYLGGLLLTKMEPDRETLRRDRKAWGPF